MSIPIINPSSKTFYRFRVISNIYYANNRYRIKVFDIDYRNEIYLDFNFYSGSYMRTTLSRLDYPEKYIFTVLFVSPSKIIVDYVLDEKQIADLILDYFLDSPAQIRDKVSEISKQSKIGYDLNYIYKNLLKYYTPYELDKYCPKLINAIKK